MGAGKDAPAAKDGGGGDGAGKDAAAAEPVVLRMELHCNGCAKKMVKCIKHMPGVESVVADAAANKVVVAGTADAAALKERIESRTKKPVEIVSAGGGAGPIKPHPAEPSKNQDKDGGEQKNPDKGGGGGADKGDKAGASQAQPKEEKETKQPPEEKKPVQDTTALLRIRLHCDACADRIRRRIYKIKGVKDVVLEEGNAKDEVKVVGTMDVAAMVVYLNEKLNRTVEAVVPGSDDAKKGKGGDGDTKQKDKAAAAAGDVHAHKEKGIEVAGPSMASAAASMAPASVMASTHHVSPYGYVPVAYPQPPQGPPPGYYSSSYYGGGNADGAGYSNAGGYEQQQRGYAGGYYQHQPSADMGSYYQHQPSVDTGSYYQQTGGYDQRPNPPPYQQYPAYPFDTAPPPQMFSDENPNSCSVM